MDRPEPVREPTNVVRLRTAGAPGPELSALLEHALRIAVGATALAAGAAADAVSRTLGFAPPVGDEPPDEEPEPVGGLPLLAGAAFGLAWESGRWGVRAVSAAARSVAPLISFAASPSIVRGRLDEAEARLVAMDARWREERPTSERAAEAFLQALVPRIVNAVLDQIDLTGIVEERVDLERVIDRVDLDAVVARVRIDDVVERLDLNEIVGRVDLDAVVRRVDLDAAVERVDLQRVVDRIDVDAIAAGVDLDAVVGRLDLAGIATRVIEEIDLPGIIRSSSETMAAETAEGIRVQGMEADRLVAGVVDRVLRRRRDRDTQVADGVAPPETEEDRT